MKTDWLFLCSGTLDTDELGIQFGDSGIMVDNVQGKRSLGIEPEQVAIDYNCKERKIFTSIV